MNNIYKKYLTKKKDIRGSLLALGLPYLTSAPIVPPHALVKPATDTINLHPLPSSPRRGMGSNPGRRRGSRVCY